MPTPSTSKIIMMIGIFNHSFLDFLLFVRICIDSSYFYFQITFTQHIIHTHPVYLSNTNNLLYMICPDIEELFSGQGDGFTVPGPPLIPGEQAKAFLFGMTIKKTFAHAFTLSTNGFL